jgi:hypothetical protein
MQQSGYVTWAGPGVEFINSAADDGSGNIYMTGYSLDGSVSEILLIKYTEAGSLSWYRLVNWTGSDWGQSVATDGMGDVYVVGIGQKSTSTQNNLDAFLDKYASNGTQLWNVTLTGPLDQDFYGVATDAAGNCYVEGFENGSVVNDYTSLLCKFASNGTQLWNRTWGGNFTFGFRVTIDQAGNIITTGCTNAMGAGNYDAFLVKYSPAGTYLWNRTWGGPESDIGEGVVTDANLNIYTCGSTQSFGPAYQSAFLAKYSPGGTQLWNRTWGGTGYSNSQGTGVTVDPAGNPCIVGITDAYGSGMDEAFAVKYSNYGTQIWNATFGFTQSAFGTGIVGNAAGDLFMCGMDTNPVTNNLDAFIVDYTPLPIPLAPVLGTVTPATSINGTLFLSWSTSTGATSYNIYEYSHPILSLNDSTVPVGTFPGTSGSATFYASGTYYFVVTAVNASGESNISNYQSGIVDLPPAGPTLISVLPATSTNGTLTITWSTSPGATSYTLYRYSHPILSLNGTVTTVGTFSTTSGKDSVFTNGTWYYAVTASNATGTSGLSNTMSAVVAITAPTLTNGAISPSIGMPSTSFTFSVTYTDANDLAPSYIDVVIDSVSYGMSYQAGIYTTGANYTYSTTLAATAHTYQFTCSDGISTASTDTSSGPLVDGTPPTNPTAPCIQLNGVTTNGTWQRSIAQPEFTWNGASDPISGVAGYYVY